MQDLPNVFMFKNFSQPDFTELSKGMEYLGLLIKKKKSSFGFSYQAAHIVKLMEAFL